MILSFFTGHAAQGVSLRAPLQEKTGQAEPPAGALVLDARPVWKPMYVGDPLAIRVQLTSPRARQEAYRELRALESGVKPKTPAFRAPAVPESWTGQVAFNLLQAQADGSSKPVLEGLAWAAFLVPLAEEAPDLSGGYGPRAHEWTVPPDQAALAEGTYILRVTWKGPDGTLTAPEARFVVKPATDKLKKVEHARRLALFEFGREHYQEALTQAKTVINADPPFTPEIAGVYMVAAAAQAGLKNWKAAADTYKKLIAWLPAKSDLTALVQDMLKYVEEQAAKPVK